MIFIDRNEVVAKVIFLHLSVTGGVLSPGAVLSPGGCLVWGGVVRGGMWSGGGLGV